MGHNHPSGDVIPSEDDVALTTRMRAAGDLLSIPVLDHLVVGDTDVFSFTAGRRFRWSSPASAMEAPVPIALFPSAAPVVAIEQEEGGDDAGAA